MKVLELFAGSRSIGKAAESLGCEVFSSDINPFPGIHYQEDIIKFDCARVPFQPDIIWASPPCTTFSVASIGTHWLPDRTPRTEASRLGLLIVARTLEIIRHFNPNFFFIENPRGMLRTLPLMNGLNRFTVTYCQYGDNRMKPTDIWTNSQAWKPKPVCKNGAPCHTAAPRGSATGTQGRSNAFERSKVPQQLCLEIIHSCLKDNFPNPKNR